MPTHLDLFSGIGGFAIAAQWAGFTTIGFCEIDPYAQRVIQKNFGAIMADANGRGFQVSEKCDGESQNSTANRDSCGRNPDGCHNAPRIHSDIFTLRGTDYRGADLITGGFPCQPYSVAGKRRGAADDRALWPEMLRVIKEARPAWVVGENVAGIINMELDRVLSDLETLGYATRPFVIPACAVDAKHRRDRVWIVANAGFRRFSGKGSRQVQQPGRTEAECGSENVGHSENGGIRRREAQRETGQSAFSSQDVANANLPRSQGRYGEELRERGGQCAAWESGSPCSWKPESDWFSESGMGRVANGIPNRVHRLRSLGNSIVPQVAYPILQAIYNDLTNA